MAGPRNRRRKVPAFEKFNPFEMFINKIASQHFLGPKGSSIVRETLDLIAEEPGCVGGFLERFKAARVARHATSRPELAAAGRLTEQELEQVLGTDVICRIANKAGVTQGFARTVLRDTIPQVAGLLLECGFSGEAIPPAATSGDEIAQYRPEQAPPGRMAEMARSTRIGRLAVPGAALLITLGVGGYLVSSSGTGHRLTSGSKTVVAQDVPAAPANQPAPSQMQSAAPAALNAPSVNSDKASIPARLALSNNNGVITISGVIGDDAAHTAVIDSLKRVFGADKIAGDLRVGQEAGPANWSQNLGAALDAFKTPGSQVLFEGDTVRVGGEIPEAERERIVSSVKSALGPKFAFSAVTSSVGAPIGAAADKAAAPTEEADNNAAPTTAAANNAGPQTAAAAPGVSKKTVVASRETAVDLPTIYFTSSGVKVPQASKALLAHLAGQIKQLPGGSVVLINGYSNRTGNPTSNIKLSQRRANAVRQALMDAGVNPAILMVKGYGGSRAPLGNNGLMEGHSSMTMKDQPRVEFRIVSQ